MKMRSRTLLSSAMLLVTFSVVAVLFATALTSCASNAPHTLYVPPAEQATIVHVTEKVYVKVDPRLTQKCPKAMPNDHSVGEAVAVAKARGSCVDQLNEHMDQISHIQGTAVPASGSSGD